jgi:hypothetical protein
MKMKKISLTIVSLLVLGVVFSFTGANSVSAARATADKGTGCFVRIGTGENDYVFTDNCAAHDVIKFDDAGNFQFYAYQDQGQLPEGSWRPEQAYRSSFEQCFEFSFGIKCGTVTEIVTPGGEYKSSFKSY